MNEREEQRSADVWSASLKRSGQGGADVSSASLRSGQDARAPLPTPFLDPYSDIDIHEHRLPHWQQGDVFYFVTYRLADALPAAKVAEWREEKESWLRYHPEPWDAKTQAEYHRRFSARIDKWLDAGYGSCLLRQPELAGVVADAFRHFDGERYDLDSFVVMPNHVHVLFRLRSGEVLEEVIHSWKSFTAKVINRAQERGRLARTGQVWQEEYWDRLIRNERHLAAVRDYITRNPKGDVGLIWQRSADVSSASLKSGQGGADVSSASLKSGQDARAPVRSSLITLLLAFMVVAVTAQAAEPQKAPSTEAATDKPNIVFILMDNLGYGEVGCYGGGITRGAATPRIDKLATEGSSGPWRGYYFTHMEGSLRTPFIIRWPNKIPAGRVSNEIVHEVDTFTTFAKIAGASVPQDRAIDGVDQVDFLFGKTEKSSREGFPVFVADRLEAVKWKNWKVVFYDEQRDWWTPPTKLGSPKAFDLITDPKEEFPATGLRNSWIASPAMKIAVDFEQSLKKHPPIAPGTADPYTPPK